MLGTSRCEFACSPPSNVSRLTCARRGTPGRPAGASAEVRAAPRSGEVGACSGRQVGSLSRALEIRRGTARAPAPSVGTDRSGMTWKRRARRAPPACTPSPALPAPRAGPRETQSLNARPAPTRASRLACRAPSRSGTARADPRSGGCSGPKRRSACCHTL